MGTFLALSFLVLASAFVPVEIIACTSFWLVSAKTTFLQAFVTFRKNFVCLFYFWTTKHNLLLTTIQGPMLVLDQEMLFRFL